MLVPDGPSHVCSGFLTRNRRLRSLRSLRSLLSLLGRWPGELEQSCPSSEKDTMTHGATHVRTTARRAHMYIMDVWTSTRLWGAVPRLWVAQVLLAQVAECSAEESPLLGPFASSETAMDGHSKGRVHAKSEEKC